MINEKVYWYQIIKEMKQYFRMYEKRSELDCSTPGLTRPQPLFNKLILTGTLAIDKALRVGGLGTNRVHSVFSYILK